MTEGERRASNDSRFEIICEFVLTVDKPPVIYFTVRFDFTPNDTVDFYRFEFSREKREPRP